MFHNVSHIRGLTHQELWKSGLTSMSRLKAKHQHSRNDRQIEAEDLYAVLFHVTW